MSLNKLRTFSCIGAMDVVQGIGKNGGIPWNLSNEFDIHFTKRSSEVKDKNKQNAIVMGRLTYFSNKVRPLINRLNIVLSKTLTPADLPENVLLFKSLRDAIAALSCEPLFTSIENIFVIGGYGAYREAVESPLCNRLYLTEIQGLFGADAFFPNFDENRFKEICVPGISLGEEEQHGIKYEMKIYSSENLL